MSPTKKPTPTLSTWVPMSTWIENPKSTDCPRCHLEATASKKNPANIEVRCHNHGHLESFLRSTRKKDYTFLDLIRAKHQAFLLAK